MSRLRYSVDGFARAVMMSSGRIVAVVEGPDDVYFYERLLREYSTYAGSAVEFQVRTPKEVSGPADGKQALLRLFTLLRRSARLTMSARGGKDLVFFADKDYDDISRRMLRSRHLIYSPAVCLENLIVDVANMRASVEAVIGQHLPSGVLDEARLDAWRVQCAQAWREWMVYCVMCEISGVAPRRNRSGLSRVHRGYPPVFQAAEFSRLMGELRTSLGGEEHVEAIRERAERAVSRALVDGDVDRVFCGKWYSFFFGQRYRRSAVSISVGRVA